MLLANFDTALTMLDVVVTSTLLVNKTPRVETLADVVLLCLIVAINLDSDDTDSANALITRQNLEAIASHALATEDVVFVVFVRLSIAGTEVALADLVSSVPLPSDAVCIDEVEDNTEVSLTIDAVCIDEVEDNTEVSLTIDGTEVESTDLI